MIGVNGNKSFIEQDFIWVAEYINGDQFFEYDPKTKKSNDFYHIQRDKLLYFGLIGHGLKLFFNVCGGTFNLQGSEIDFVYKTKDKCYNLTKNTTEFYRDIIQYKDASSTLDFKQLGKGKAGDILQYNFGYKHKLKIDNVVFNFKAIVHIPFDKPIYMKYRLVANKTLDGHFIILRNGREIKSIHAPLKAGVAGETSWIVRV